MTIKVLKQLDLSQRPLGQDGLFEYFGNLLNGHLLARLGVGCGTSSFALQSSIQKDRTKPSSIEGTLLISLLGRHVSY